MRRGINFQTRITIRKDQAEHGLKKKSYIEILDWVRSRT